MIRICSIIIVVIFITVSYCYACTIFSIKTKDNIYYCNHEDYFDYDTMLWIRPGKNKKLGAIYYGYNFIQEPYKKNYANSPHLMVGDIHPDGGMNEKGLSWDWVADGTVWGENKDSDKPVYKKSHIFYDIIQQYSTVDEAIDFMREYKFPSYVGRTLMSDRFGDSVVIYAEEGKLIVEKAERNYQIIGYGERTRAKSMLNAGEYKNIKQIADILDASHQGILNQYSSINDPVNKIIYLYHFHNFEEFIKIDMLCEFSFGEKSYSIPSLFSKIKILPPTIIRKSDSASVTFKWKGKPESIYKLLYSKDKNFDNYKEVSINSSPDFNYAFLSLSIPVLFLLGSVKMKMRYFLILFILIAFFQMPGCDEPQQAAEAKRTYENYINNLPKYEIKEFSKTIDNLELNTTYYWKIVAHPKENDHFLSQTFVFNFNME